MSERDPEAVAAEIVANIDADWSFDGQAGHHAKRLAMNETKAAIVAALRSARDAALEEAAKVCDTQADLCAQQANDGSKEDRFAWGIAQAGSMQAALNVRSLKSDAP